MSTDRVVHRVLVIGVGSMGEGHVRCLGRTGRATVGICETNSAVREQVARRYGIDEQFDDVHAALDRPWDAAVVATPAPTHVPLAQLVAEAGPAVLIEKPLAITFDGIAALLALVRERKLVAAVAYVYRAHKALAAMRRAVAGGRFGRPLQVVFVAGQYFPMYRPAYREIYYARHDSGGGAIQDALTHSMNAVQWLVGPMTSVAADAAHLALPGVEVEDTVNLLARHGQVLASYSLNQHQPMNENALTVICERGVVRMLLHEHRWQWMDQPGDEWQVEESVYADRDDWFTAQEHAWLDAVQGVAPPLCTLEEGVQTLAAQRAVLASAADRRWVDVTEEALA